MTAALRTYTEAVRGIVTLAAETLARAKYVG
jgi:hypothetical protein